MSKSQVQEAYIDAQQNVVEQIVDALNKNPNKKDLQKKASTFLKALKDLRDKLKQVDKIIVNYKGIERGLLSHRQAIAKAIGNTKGDIRKEFEKVRDDFIKQYNFEKRQNDIIALADKLFYKMESFQKAIGLLRNQVFRIFYVFPDVDGSPVIAMVPLKDLLSSYYSASDKDIIGKLSFGETELKKLKRIRDINTIQHRQKGIIELYKRQQIKTLDDVYSEVVKRRTSDYIQWDNKKTKKKKQQIVPVFLAERAKFYYILNLGDVGEGYASFYFDRNKCDDLERQESKQEQIDYFIINGILPVNNQSGLLQQDIQFVLESGVTIQGAVKSIDSHLMGYKQIEYLATKIANGEAVTEADIKKYIFIKEGQGIRNRFIGKVEQGVKELTENAISQLFSKNAPKEAKSTKKKKS